MVAGTEGVGREQIQESAGRRVGRMAQFPTKTMAVTLLTPALASGRRVLAMFRSVFALVLDVLRSAFRHTLHHFFPPASATAPASPSPKPLDQQTGQPQPSTTLPPPASESNPSHRVDQVGIRSEPNSDDSMTATAASLPPGTNNYLKKRPAVIPAVPILPLPLPKRDNIPLKTTTSAASSARSTASATLSSSAGTTVSRLSNGVANLRLEGAPSGKGPATAARPAADENTASTGNGNGKQTTTNADPFCSPPFLDLGANGDTREVLRAPAVPMMHDVSQTSKLKETASSKASDDGVLAQAKPDTPEQAAERAIHSGFMREALDMVRCGCIFLLSSPSSCRVCLAPSSVWYHSITSRVGRVRDGRPRPSRRRTGTRSTRKISGCRIAITADRMRLPLHKAPLITAVPRLPWLHCQPKFGAALVPQHWDNEPADLDLRTSITNPSHRLDWP